MYIQFGSVTHTFGSGFGLDLVKTITKPYPLKHCSVFPKPNHYPVKRFLTALTGSVLHGFSCNCHP